MKYEKRIVVFTFFVFQTFLRHEKRIVVFTFFVFQTFLRHEKRIVVFTFLVFQTFFRQFVTENSENFYEGQKLLSKGCSSQEIMKTIFK